MDKMLLTLRRRADQAWELAGCARVDGDTAEEQRLTALAREYDWQIGEILRSQQPPPPSRAGKTNGQILYESNSGRDVPWHLITSRCQQTYEDSAKLHWMFAKAEEN